MNWYVIGAGRSGLAAAEYLLGRQGCVVIMDENPVSDAIKRGFMGRGVAFIDGEPFPCAPQDDVCGLVLSPGINGSIPLVQAARDRGIPVVSETELALPEFKGTLLGVTGTNGKSTTVALAVHILQKSGIKALAAGNIGLPVSEIAASGWGADCLVLELSSYQLEHTGSLVLDAGAFLNISQDHLERHGTRQQYFREKWKLASFIKEGGLFLAHQPLLEEAASYGLSAPSHCRLLLFDDHDPVPDFLPKHGFFSLPHNRINALAAIGLASLVSGRDFSDCGSLAGDFSGLPHRCELIPGSGSRRVINDSKSTNVASTLAALRSMEKPVILMIGGQGKGESWESLVEEKKRIRLLLVFGNSAKDILRETTGLAPRMAFSTLKEAMEHLPGLFRCWEGDILFSPGCASFDEFRNFEQRGSFFKSAVRDSLHLFR